MFRVKNRIAVTNEGKKLRLLSHQKGSGPDRKRGAAMGLSQAETANLNAPGGGMSMNNLSMSAIGSGQRGQLDLILTGIVNDQQLPQMRKFYRDIYHYDAISGSTVDLMSTLPFSNFTLSGAPNKMLDVYNSAIERLNFKSINPEISTCYLVDGEFCATTVYDRRVKGFTDLLPYKLDTCEMQYMPFYSMDPVITVNMNKDMEEFLNSSDDAITRLHKLVPQQLLSAMKEGSYTLDPLTTLYMARRSLTDPHPQSYFKRILPIYLLEKTMIRGTLTEASKRQRSSLHVQAGDDNWEPTGEELAALVALFQQADLDPLGATIATRQAITASEIRQGGDFWKWTDMVDSLNGLKMRALGISETFLSGDQSYNTAEVSLSVFIENLKAYREYFTHKMFTNKLFPVIAAVNGFTKEAQQKMMKEHASDMGLSFKVNDASKYVIPTVRWHKSLEPHTDRDTMEMLDAMAEKGIPIPIRLIAAAGGLQLDNILQEMEEDVVVRKRLMEYNKKLQAVAGPAEGEGGEGDSAGGDYDFSEIEDDTGTAEASLREELQKIGFKTGIQRTPLLARNFEKDFEIVGRTVTGKKTYIHNQRGAHKKANMDIARAMTNLSDPNHYDKIVRSVKSRINPQGT